MSATRAYGASIRQATASAGAALLALLVNVGAGAAQDRPDPTRELMARTYCGVSVDGSQVIAGTTFGLVRYRLPSSRPTGDGPQAVLVGPEPVVMLPDSVNDVWVSKGRVFTAIGPSGIRIVPLDEEGGRPRPEGIVDLETSGAALSAVVEGDLLVAALGVMGIAVWDVSDPTRPIQRLIQDTGGYARHVVVKSAQGVQGNELWVYVANGRQGVARLRLTADGASVVETGVMESAGDVRRLHPFRDGLLFSRGHEGLCYVDAALSPDSVACVPAGDVIRGIASSGNTVIGADGGTGLLVVDWSDLRKPSAPMHFPVTDGSANRVSVSGSTVIVAADFLGIRVFTVDQLPSSTSSHPPEATP